MSFFFNGTIITEVIYNGVSLTDMKYNGVTVFEQYEEIPLHLYAYPMGMWGWEGLPSEPWFWSNMKDDWKAADRLAEREDFAQRYRDRGIDIDSGGIDVSSSVGGSASGIIGLAEETAAVLPLEQILALYYKKTELNPLFASGFPTDDDWTDFLALMPVDQMVEIFNRYLHSDAGVQEEFADLGYVLSPYFFSEEPEPVLFYIEQGYSLTGDKVIVLRFFFPQPDGTVISSSYARSSDGTVIGKNALVLGEGYVETIPYETE